jgi:hypothetical protein
MLQAFISDCTGEAALCMSAGQQQLFFGKRITASYQWRNSVTYSIFVRLRCRKTEGNLLSAFIACQKVCWVTGPLWTLLLPRGRDIVVGIATGYGLNNRGFGVRVPVGSRIFSMSRPSLGSTQPHIQGVPGLKRPERDAYHSPPTSTEVKKMWIYTSTPTPTRFHGVVLN